MTTAIQTARLQQAQIPDAAEVLARAFFDDPLISWWIPDDERRRKSLPWFMSAPTKLGLKSGEVETTSGTIEGAAVWLAPGKTTISPVDMLFAGMMLAPFKIGWTGFQRLMKTMNIVEKAHKQHVPEDHWYLAVLGVDPPRQGQGIGSALMQPVLAKADATHLPAYLETQKEINVSLYRKHGFDVVEEMDLPGGGPHIWYMKRAAR